MANTIQFRRGLNSALPTLAAGEPGWVTDTSKLYVGTGAGNKRLVMAEEYGAYSILYADTDDTPTALTVNASTVVGRKASGGIAALTGAELLAVASGQAAASFSMNSQKITSLATPGDAGDAATKGYVDTLVGAGINWLAAVKDKDTLTPPGSPTLGDRYWIGGTGTDAWAGHNYDVAEYNGSGWTFTDVTEGDAGYVDDENAFYYFNGSSLALFAVAMGAHASTHVNGTDDIQLATAAQKGLMSLTYASKLDGIEASADVTDATNVAAAGAIMDGDFTGASGFMRKTGTGTYEAILANMAASAAPTANEDSGDGYAVGSIWLDTTADKAYICLDASVGAAVWTELGGAGSGANTALSNLASVALNTALLPDAAAADDFGSATLPFKDLFFAGSSSTPGTNNFKITGASTSGTRVITFPDSTGTVLNNYSTIDGGAFV